MGRLCRTLPGLAIWLLLALAVPASGQGDPAAELAAVRERMAALETRFQELNARNEQTGRQLEQRLTELRARSPRPLEDIQRAQLALAEVDDRRLQLIEGYDRRRAPLEQRAQELEQQLANPAEPDAGQGQGQGRAEPPAAANAPDRDENWGATGALRRDLLEEDLGERGRIPGDGGQGPARRGEDPGGGQATPEPTTPLARALAQPQVQEDIGSYQRGRAGRAYDALSPDEQTRFDELLAAHEGNPAAQAALAKALGSGNSLGDIAWLSGELQGKDADWIRTNTTLTGHGTDGLRQQFQASCVPTTMQALHGEFDPVYALRRRQQGPVDQVDTTDPYKYNPDLATEQRVLLETPYDGGLTDTQGNTGRATPRDAGGRGRPALDDLANDLYRQTGLEYQEVLNPDGSRLTGDQALPILDAALSQGVPVPMAVGPPDHAQHAVLAYDRREVTRDDGSQELEYRIFDPWEGTSTWVPRSDIENHSIQAVAGQPALFRVLEPGRVDRPVNDALAAYNAAKGPPPPIDEPTPPPPVTRPGPREVTPPAPLELPVIRPLEPIQLEPLRVDPPAESSPEVVTAPMGAGS